MPDHVSFDGARDCAPMLIEDFLATCPQVYLAKDHELWQCEAEQRGGAIWLMPEEALPIDTGERLLLCCPHSSGLYRFKVDIIEAEADRIICTRAVDEPLGKRVSMRGDIEIAVRMTPAGGAGPSVAGRTRNLSRLGMLVLTPEPIAVRSEWRCHLRLDAAAPLEVHGVIVREAPDEAHGPERAYGCQFFDVPVDVQRRIFDFLIANADLASGGPGPGRP